jgi:hypothetical protein
MERGLSILRNSEVLFGQYEGMPFSPHLMLQTKMPECCFAKGLHTIKRRAGPRWRVACYCCNNCLLQPACCCQLTSDSEAVNACGSQQCHNGATALHPEVVAVGAVFPFLCVCWQAGPADHAYSALTASSQLQYLQVCAEDYMPAESWSHFLRAGRQLPHLQVLLENAREDCTDSPWGCVDVSRFVAACPTLCQLSVSAKCSPQQLGPLSRLTGLRQLAVGVTDYLLEGSWPGGRWKPNEPVAEMAALAQLTALQGLTLFTSRDFDYLMALTHLQQLRYIAVHDSYEDRLRVSVLFGEGGTNLGLRETDSASYRFRRWNCSVLLIDDLGCALQWHNCEAVHISTPRPLALQHAMHHGTCGCTPSSTGTILCMQL